MQSLAKFLVSLLILFAVAETAFSQDDTSTEGAKGTLALDAKGSTDTKSAPTVDAKATVKDEAKTTSNASSSTQEATPGPTSEPAPSAQTPQGAQGETANSAPSDKTVTAGTYGVRLRDLEQRINELKEQIFRSKARLSLLAETVLQGVVAGSQATLVHENRMGSSYLLVKVVYALDGAPIFNKTDEEGGLEDQEKFDIYNGSIVPGEHTLTVNLEYRGHGYGIFSYLKGYRFKVRSNYTFTAPEGKAIVVRVVGFEKGGPTAPLEERPAIRYVERVANDTKSALQEGGE
jgi:hypothetical protein